MSTIEHLQFAGIILPTERGLALQERDHNPGTKNPGAIAGFGGLLEPEDGCQTDLGAIRELSEEVKYLLRREQIFQFASFERPGGKIWCNYFTLKPNEPLVLSSCLKLMEGASIFYLPQRRNDILDFVHHTASYTGDPHSYASEATRIALLEYCRQGLYLIDRKK